jgi:hypothetical protein
LIQRNQDLPGLAETAQADARRVAAHEKETQLEGQEMRSQRLHDLRARRDLHNVQGRLTLGSAVTEVGIGSLRGHLVMPDGLQCGLRRGCPGFQLRGKAVRLSAH